MESEDLYYCLNPNCSQHENRVFPKEKQAQLHYNCQRWVASERYIASLSEDNLPFDLEAPLTFNSQPIITQAYLHLHKEEITRFLTQYAQALRSQIQKELIQLDNHVSKTLNRIFNFRKYSEIDELTKQEGLNVNLKSMRLSQLLKKPLPLYQNTTLPSYKTSRLIIQNIHRDLEQLFQLQSKEKTTIKRNDEVMPKIEYKTEEVKVKLEFFDNAILSLSGSSNIKQLTPSKEIAKKEDNQQNLWEYILKNCNLKTATQLMGQPLQKFYAHDAELKQSTVKCCYCSFQVKIKTKTRPQTHSACSYAILEHLYKDHNSTTLYHFCFVNGSYTNISLISLLDKIRYEDVDSIVIIDSSSFSSIQKLDIEQNSFAVEIIYGGNKPLFRNSFLKGGNSRELLILIGLLIYHVSVDLRKKLTIYTSDQKCQVINNFCTFYKIEGAVSVSGNQKVKMGVESIKREKEILEEQSTQSN